MGFKRGERGSQPRVPLIAAYRAILPDRLGAWGSTLGARKIATSLLLMKAFGGLPPRDRSRYRTKGKRWYNQRAKATIQPVRVRNAAFGDQT